MDLPRVIGFQLSEKNRFYQHLFSENKKENKAVAFRFVGDFRSNKNIRELTPPEQKRRSNSGLVFDLSHSDFRSQYELIKAYRKPLDTERSTQDTTRLNAQPNGQISNRSDNKTKSISQQEYSQSHDANTRIENNNSSFVDKEETEVISKPEYSRKASNLSSTSNHSVQSSLQYITSPSRAPSPEQDDLPFDNTEDEEEQLSEEELLELDKQKEIFNNVVSEYKESIGDAETSSVSTRRRFNVDSTSGDVETTLKRRHDDNNDDDDDDVGVEMKNDIAQYDGNYREDHQNGEQEIYQKEQEKTIEDTINISQPENVVTQPANNHILLNSTAFDIGSIMLSQNHEDITFDKETFHVPTLEITPRSNRIKPRAMTGKDTLTKNYSYLIDELEQNPLKFSTSNHEKDLSSRVVETSQTSTNRNKIESDSFINSHNRNGGTVLPPNNIKEQSEIAIPNHRMYNPNSQTISTKVQQKYENGYQQNDNLNYNDRYNEHSKPSTSRSSYRSGPPLDMPKKICIMCNLHVRPHEQYLHENQVMHRQCLKCIECQTPLFMHEKRENGFGQIFCVDCFNRYSYREPLWVSS